MSLTEKLQSVFVIIAILIGLILGQIKWVEERTACHGASLPVIALSAS